MGVHSSKCVYLADAPGFAGLAADTYTVIRTSGEQQTGWQMSKEVHRCFNQNLGAWRPTAHALLKKDGWSVYMHNGHHTDKEGTVDPKHACGWRTIGTFWPTRLTGDQAAIDAWSSALRDLVELLAGEQGLPDVWHEHICNRGSPANLCSGCFAIDRAEDKRKLLEERKAGPTAERLVEIDAELAKIPTAAQIRSWKAWRDVADKLEEAQYKQRCNPLAELEEKIATLQREADELYPVAFPSPPAAPAASAERVPTPPPAQPEKLTSPAEDEVLAEALAWHAAPEQAAVRRAAENAAADKMDDALDAALDELGAKPYHPIYAPLHVKPLPDPMDAATRARVLGRMRAPEKPDMHGCQYADPGCPWSICYACEYEKNPATYERSIRHSQLIQLISAYWRSPAVGELAKHWDNEFLEDIVAELDRPHAERAFTAAQLADLRIHDDFHHRKSMLLYGLRKLHGVE